VYHAWNERETNGEHSGGRGGSTGEEFSTEPSRRADALENSAVKRSDLIPVRLCQGFHQRGR
jgi:hypothetical protein